MPACSKAKCHSFELSFAALSRKLGDKKGRAEAHPAVMLWHLCHSHRAVVGLGIHRCHGGQAAQLVSDVHFALASIGQGNPQARH